MIGALLLAALMCVLRLVVIFSARRYFALKPKIQ